MTKAFDFDRALRWARLDKHGTLARRSDDELPMLDVARPGRGLLLDTCVYIDQMQGRAPTVVGELIGLRQVNHSSVAVAELMHAVGRLDPHHPGSAGAIREIGRTINAIPPHRLFTPDVDVTGRAAILAGILSRTQGYGTDNRLRATNKCLLFLQAAKLGLTVLSRNTRDFDCLSQMLPKSSVLFYRAAA
ncbi:MAG: type II toxin-antitoxin system VapC family toxin [Pararhizobium sp.]